MMKMKRFAALLIAFAVVAAAGIFSVPVFAEDAEVLTETPAIVITEADRLLVEKLEAFGIVKDIEADLTAKVTRREMVDLVADYMRIPTASVDYDTLPFLDVLTSDPSVDAIMALYNAKIVTGDDTFRFYPDSYLNYDEALVFVVNAIGYKMFAVRDGGFPTGYHRVAIKLGMLKDLAMQSGRDDITRLDVYKLFEAGLRAAAITYGTYTENETEYTVSTTDDFLSDTYGITTHKGIITGTEDTHLQSASSRMTDEQIEIDYTLYDTPGYIYATSLGRSVIYYLRQDNDGNKEIAYIEENDALNHVTKIDAQNLIPGKTTATRVYYNDEEGKEYHIDFIAGVDVIYNGRAYRGYGSIAAVLPTAGYIEALDNDGDDVADVLFVYSYYNAQVGSVDTYASKIIPTSGPHISCDIEAGNAKVYIDSEMRKIDLKEIPINSIISVMESKGTPKLTTVYVSRKLVSGEISEVLSDGTVILEGKAYKKANDYTGVSLTAGKVVDLRLNLNSEIVLGAYSAAGSDGYEFAILAGIDYEQGGLSNSIKLKLYTTLGFIFADVKDPVRVNDVSYDMTPANMATVLGILSGGATDYAGRYTVTRANVIRYRLDGDVISHLDTGTTGIAGNLRLIEDNVDSVLLRGTIYEIIDYDDVAQAINTVKYASYDSNKKTVIFTAPSDDDPSTPAVNEFMENEDGFSTLEKMSQNYYRNYAAGSQYTELVDNSALYTLSDDLLNPVHALLLRGAGSTAQEISATSKICLITKVTTALDADGFSCKKMYFGDSSAILSDTVKLTNNTHNAVNFSSSAPEINALKPGDVLQFGYAEDGKVNAIKVISEYNAATQVLTPHVSIEDYTTGSKVSTGVVTGVDPNQKAVFFDAPSGSECLCKATGNIYIYRAAEQKLTTAVLSEISAGDKIVVRIADYFDAPEIYVIR